jgi:hypothetical protein
MKTITAVLTSAFLITGAYAQAPSSSPAKAPSSGASTAAMAKADAKQDMAVESHIKNMHAQLQITSAEETQWAAVAKTMRDSAIETDKAIDKREALVNSASAVECLCGHRPGSCGWCQETRCGLCSAVCLDVGRPKKGGRRAICSPRA